MGSKKTRKKRSVVKNTSTTTPSPAAPPAAPSAVQSAGGTTTKKRKAKKSRKDVEEEWQSKKRKIERKIKNTKQNAKNAKKNKAKQQQQQKTKDYRSILEYKSDKDMRNVEKRLRERLKKKRQEEVDEEEELLKSSSDSPQSSSDSNSGSESSSLGSSTTTEDKKKEEEAGEGDAEGDEDEEMKEALDITRRASVIASSNVNPSDGDDEGSNDRSDTSKDSDGGSLDSNRSHLSSHSKKSSLTRARNAAAGKLSAPGDKEFAEYDLIERQLMADQEKELEYLNGLDQPINKADLPLLCPDENHNGPPMNEPMKLRIQRLKRTKIWVRNIPAVKPMLRDEVDEYIERQEARKKKEKDEEIEFESIFDQAESGAPVNVNERTLEMESNLKLAILKRLNQSTSA